MMTMAGAEFVDHTQLLSEIPTVDSVAETPTVAWQNVLRAYATLRIPVLRYDTIQHAIGGSAEPMGTIGGKHPSTWIDCGRGVSDDYADTHRVAFAIATSVFERPAGSIVETLLVASARPGDVKTDAVKCVTRGTLEAQIAGRRP
jgi:hypothetical protein